MLKLVSLLLLLGTAATVSLGSPAGDEKPTLTSHGFTTSPGPTEAKSRFAMLDDVRLLANGLLQLGQSLREFVHKTKAQINDIFHKLNIFDRSFYHLSVVTSEIKEEEEELKKTTNYLKVNNEEIRNLSLEINVKINNIVQERTQLQSQVGSLEEKLKGLSQGMIPVEYLNEITSLKEVIETQEKTITNLLKAVQEQHEQLEHQKIKIKNMEEKLSDDNYQDTIDKKDGDATSTDMFEYVSENSTGLENTDLPKDCSEMFDSGIHVIKPKQSEPFNVYCEMGPDGGSTVIQRRMGGSTDFDRTWSKYEKGFGDLEKDFWLGLKKIHSLTQEGAHILRIDLVDWKEEKHWAEYSFSLEGPSEQYTLNLANFSGNLPDAMTNSSGLSFATNDKSNRNQINASCSRAYTGGWWFNSCGENNLNGRYYWLRAKGRSIRRKGLYWKQGEGQTYFLKTTKMSLRPIASAKDIN
ncbi:angiopoietin-related protein 3 [Synchiropus picturatus]